MTANEIAEAHPLQAAAEMRSPYHVQAEIIEASAKALLIEVSAGVVATRRLWVPKSVCGWKANATYGPLFMVEKWLVAREKLWNA